MVNALLYNFSSAGMLHDHRTDRGTIMKKQVIGFVALFLLTAGQSTAQMHGGMMGDAPRDPKGSDEKMYLHHMGQGMMHRGKMNYCDMEPGMMHRGMMGYGMGACMPGCGLGNCMMHGGMMGLEMGLGMGPMMGEKMMEGLPKEKRNAFFNETVDLRKKLHAKQFDFFEAQRSTDTDRGIVLKLERDIFELKQQLREKMLDIVKE